MPPHVSYTDDGVADGDRLTLAAERRPHGRAPTDEPPILARLKAERVRRDARHALLTKVLRRLLRPCRGGIVIVTTLKRLLRMAGLDPTVAELVAGALEVGGRFSRAARGREPDWRRAFADVELHPDKLLHVAGLVGNEWEARLRSEGMVPEPPLHSRSRRLESGTAAQEDEHIVLRATIANHVDESLSTYLEFRADDISPQDRRAIELFMGGMAERKIAEALGLPYGTLRQRLGRHRVRAGIGVPPRLRRARRYLDTHDWGSDPVRERAIWERFAAGEGYRTIARALAMEWRDVVAALQKHRIRAGIDLG